MVTIILVLFFILWLFSYIRFKKKIAYYNVMLNVLLDESNGSFNYSLYLRIASVLTELQRYKDAYSVYEYIDSHFSDIPEIDSYKINKDFCLHPVPGVKKAKNYHSSWIHNFYLVRFGRKRFRHITEEDYLNTNSAIRKMKS